MKGSVDHEVNSVKNKRQTKDDVEEVDDKRFEKSAFR